MPTLGFRNQPHPMTTPNQAAARWWADQLRTVTKQDNGVPLHGVLATMAGKLPAAEVVDRFEKHLLESLNSSTVRILATDYGPVGLLADVAETVGVRPTCGPFPMKTVMWIEQGTVIVRHGYGAECKQIFPDDPQESTNP